MVGEVFAVDPSITFGATCIEGCSAAQKEVAGRHLQVPGGIWHEGRLKTYARDKRNWANMEAQFVKWGQERLT